MSRMNIAVLLICMAPAGHLRADEPPDPPAAEDDARGIARLAGITRQLQQLGDWDSLYETVSPGIDEFWEQRGWTEEADEFARQTLQDVAAIPPWEFQKRMDRLMGAVRDRYELTDAQYDDLQGRTYQFIGGMVWRHGRTFYRQTKEMVETRVRGEPFSPEQVARWTRETEPVFEDERARFEDLADQLASSFTPQQREIYERDLASYRRRMQAVNELRERWEAGDWQPEDWGLQHDPIHQPLLDASRAEAEGRDGTQPAPSGAESAGDGSPAEENGVVALDESTWARYVRQFVKHYQLDDAQATAAWSILHELEERAADYRRLHRDEFDRVQPEEASTAQVYRPLREMFDELKRRLHPIPTDHQRRRASLEAMGPRRSKQGR
jgi:hypothetical protein